MDGQTVRRPFLACLPVCCAAWVPMRSSISSFIPSSYIQTAFLDPMGFLPVPRLNQVSLPRHVLFLLALIALCFVHPSKK
mmetsp:Transcript_1849/g.3856  ORF Transcript_1849/g.3856 Transcript_1849/m.3856 type:complete len:80 (-) Transcript_1849:1254-1493(-)